MAKKEKKKNDIESVETQINPEKKESFEDQENEFEKDAEKQISDFKNGDEEKIEMIEKLAGLGDGVVEEVKKELKVEETLEDLNKKVNELIIVIKNKLEKIKLFTQKFRYSDKFNKILKTAIAAEIMIGSAIIGDEVYAVIKDKEKQEVEAIDKAKSYCIEDDIKNQDFSRFFTDLFTISSLF